MGKLSAIMLGLALAGATVGAAAQDDEVQKVPVNGVKNPEMKSYRAVWAGLKTFDREHDLAPSVPQLRFRIMTKNSKAFCVGICSGSIAGVPDPNERFALRIAGDELSVPVPISTDGFFSIPRDRALYDANADLILDRKKDSYKFGVEVRTPGLPDNVRRLGDLRLECKVQVAIAKEEIPFWIVALANSVLLSTDWCMTTMGDGKTHFSYYSPAPVLSATLVDGNRSKKLDTGKHSYQVNLGDKSWSDDALVQLAYAQDE
jgi:hypothetical protein